MKLSRENSPGRAGNFMFESFPQRNFSRRVDGISYGGVEADLLN